MPRHPSFQGIPKSNSRNFTPRFRARAARHGHCQVTKLFWRGASDEHLGKGEVEMRKQLIRISLVAGLVALFMPVVASAQSWPYPDNRRDRDYGRYDSRYVRDSIHRLDRLAKDFERDLDRTLDRSRANGTRREDALNNEARQFRDAVGDLKSRFGNGRDLNRSRNEAQRVLTEGQRLERVVGRVAYQTGNRWSQIRQELNIISDAYNLGYYGGNDDWRRDRRDRDDDYRRRDNRNDVPWWERIRRFPN
jgi:hypothetical protein